MSAGLVDQNIEVPFTSGLDTKTDTKLAAKLLELENAVFTGPGTVSKREGTTQMTDASTLVSPVPDALALDSFGAAQLRWSSDGLYTYSESADQWAYRPSDVPILPATVERMSVERNNNSQNSPDHARIGNYTVFAWVDTYENSLGAITNAGKYSVYDEVSETYLVSAGFLSTVNGGTLLGGVVDVSPRLVVRDGKILIFYTDYNTTSSQAFLALRVFDPASPGLLGSQITVVGNIESQFPVFEAHTLSSNTTETLLVYRTAVSANVTLRKVNEVGVTIATATVAGGSGNVVQLYEFASGRMLLVNHESATTRIAARVYDVAGASITLFAGPVTLHTISGAEQPPTAIVIEQGLPDAGLWVLYQPSGSAILFNRVNEALTVVSASTSWAYNCRLAAKPFVLDGATYQPISVATGGLDAYIRRASVPVTLAVLLRDPSVVLARMLTGTAGYAPTYRLSTSVVASISQVSLFLPERGRNFVSAVDGETVDLTPVGLSRVLLESVSQAAIGRTTIQDSILLVAGAQPLQYDGRWLTESGFHVSPDIDLLSAGASGDLSTGTYSVVAVYEWVNGLGQLERSVPSIPRTIDVVSGQKLTATVRSVNFTAKGPAYSITGALTSPVTIAIYRTEANGSIYYRESTVPSATRNSTVTETSLFEVTKADADVIGGEILYTSGAVLDYYPPPPHRFSHQHKEYVFLGGLEDPYEVAYSLPLASGEAVAFNPNLSLKVPTNTGKVTGLATLDGVLVIFTEQAAYTVAGDGPDATGGSNSFGQPQKITDSVGCVDWRTVVSVPNGLMHKANSGIHLLNRGLSTVYVGAGVESYNSLHITSAKYSQDIKQVRFHTEEGTTLVWDDYFQQWSTFTGQYAVDATIWGGKFVYADGLSVFRDTPGTWLEGVSPYSMKVGTSWLKVAGIQGYQRVRRMLLTGDFRAEEKPVTLTTDVRVDYVEDDIAETSTESFTSSPTGVYISPRTTVANSAGAFGPILTTDGTYNIGPHAVSVAVVDPTPDNTFIWRLDGVDQQDNIPMFPNGGSEPIPLLLTDGTPTGLSVTWGGVPPVYSNGDEWRWDEVSSHRVQSSRLFQVERHLKRQKCESMRATWTVDSNSPGVSFAGVTLRVATKRGAYKPAKVRTIR